MNNIYDMLNDIKDNPVNEIGNDRNMGKIERIELTDVEKKKLMKNLAGKQYKRHSGRKVAAAAACAVILVAGTTAYAAVKRFGIADYLARRNEDIPQEQVEKLLDTEVEQEVSAVDQKEDALVHFRIREALCDNNQLVVEVEATPTDPEHYILAPTDSALDMPVTDLGIEGVTEGTVGEYAAAQGKEVLLVGARVEDESIWENSAHFETESDGTLVIVVNATNARKEDIMNLVCHTTYHNANTFEMEDVVHDSFAFQLTDESTAEQVVYVPETEVKLNDAVGSVVDELIVNKTELTVAITLKWHATKELDDENRVACDTDYRFYTEDGKELRFIEEAGPGILWKGDGFYEETLVYEVMDLPDTLIVKAVGVEHDKEEYGMVRVHLQ